MSVGKGGCFSPDECPGITICQIRKSLKAEFSHYLQIFENIFASILFCYTSDIGIIFIKYSDPCFITFVWKTQTTVFQYCNIGHFHLFSPELQTGIFRLLPGLLSFLSVFSPLIFFFSIIEVYFPGNKEQEGLYSAKCNSKTFLPVEIRRCYSRLTLQLVGSSY